MIGGSYAGYVKAYSILHDNRTRFSELIDEILRFYSATPNSVPEIKRDFRIENKLTAQQLYSPSKGKGLNHYKANNSALKNLKSYWVQELMRISGALHMMICQLVESDLKIYVPEYKHVIWSKAKELMLEFKRYLKSNSPVKLDIINLIDYSVKFIQRSADFSGKLKNAVKGFHSVYQKDLGQNRAVINIAFLETPDFIEIKDRESAGEWIEVLDAQRRIINAIKEESKTIQGLLKYRNFLSGGDLQSFFEFSKWYSVYLMQKKASDKRQSYVKPFTIETLNLFYKHMDNPTLNLGDIIANKGFQAVAQAIRKSTVSLHYAPEEERKFGIRYGLAQELQNKSKSKLDLAVFIGEFIAAYNAETAKAAEKNRAKPLRANVKDEELSLFYTLLDKYPSRLVGALLASYGFALKSGEVKEKETEDVNEEDEQF